MEKFKIVYSIIINTWKVISKYKNKDVTQDKECRQLLDELQSVCDMFRLQVGEAEGKLAREVCGAFLEYLCKEEL